MLLIEMTEIYAKNAHHQFYFDSLLLWEVAEISGVARAPQAPRPRGGGGARGAEGARQGPPGPARKK